MLDYAGLIYCEQLVQANMCAAGVHGRDTSTRLC
jgi:hypothetical protein